MYVSVKAFSEDVPLGEIVFLRVFFALIPLIIFLWIRNEFPGGLARRRPVDHFLRAAFIAEQVMNWSRQRHDIIAAALASDKRRAKTLHLDTSLSGHDTDIKHTIGNRWMIPP